MKTSICEWVVLCIVCIGLYSFTVTVLDAVTEPVPTARSPQPYTGPEIPECDLPLWDRIRFECPKESNNEDTK